MEAKNTPAVLPQGEYIQGLAELGKYTGTSIPTSKKLLTDGKIPYYQIGRKYFFEKSEIQKAFKKGGKVG
ncbi:excisionase family DNA binding protein [Algoriphagus ratkowskyi]|uniref:Excisionase family DNA binding protein n=1 Tax=Algoriphagus ratkowskyi TaxID=57028 RepID=A0A2W7RGY6_9BACT|nr:excisionase family DNA-binding protein [Algoriphagus ratkowskyi]PZX60198.1 excisionase family DNA binding protein [Algoriphagus ratkowskyi]TXD78023.1 helix-turn-helix domain-containing protein [Algoriphagus ratkowskyi]